MLERFCYVKQFGNINTGSDFYKDCTLATYFFYNSVVSHLISL